MHRALQDEPEPVNRKLEGEKVPSPVGSSGLHLQPCLVLWLRPRLCREVGARPGTRRMLQMVLGIHDRRRFMRYRALILGPDPRRVLHRR